MKDIYAKIAAIIRSRRFFYATLVLFVFEASWIALSSHYPMAFDENFHFGIIKLYAHHVSPWWNAQPAGANVFGAVWRDPSYLYHWLMSFPYRLISQFFHEMLGQVIALRLINVSLFTAGLVIMRKVLLKASRSTALVNLVLLFLILTPVIPSLAGQINYDNLLFLVVGVSLLMTANFIEKLSQRKRLDLGLLVGLIILCLLSSLVKYAFLPVFFAIAVFILIYGWRLYHRSGRHLLTELAAAYRRLSYISKFSLLIGLCVSGVLFFERYGINAIHYHTPLPECNQVLSVKQCLAYSPWARNYNIELSKHQPGTVVTNYNTLSFSQHWAFTLYQSLFYVLNGPDSGYAVGSPLVLPIVVAVLVMVAGLFYLSRYRRQIFRDNPIRILLVALIAIYGAALWFQNYSDYLHLGQPVALQGRYLVPILAPLYLLFGIAIARATRMHKQTQVLLATIAVLLFLQGGGIVTFLVRSDDSWYINNSISAKVNDKVQPVVKHIVIGK